MVEGLVCQRQKVHMFPDFIVIGAMKAGTTALYGFLCQHPEIIMSSRKELGFYAFEGEDPSAMWKGLVGNIKEYQAFFSDPLRDNQLVRGEVSSVYMHFPTSISRMQYYVPSVKLIAILRDPCERAYSHYLYNVRDGREKERTFLKAIQRDDNARKQSEANKYFGYLEKGLYFEQLSPYFQSFRRDQIMTLLYEDFCSNPEASMKKLYEYIGVDYQIDIDYRKRYNESYIPRSRAVYSFMHGNSNLRQFIRSFVPTSYKKAIRQTINRLNVAGRKDCDPESLNFLIQFYREDTAKLERLIGIDLTDWKTSEGNIR